MNRPTLVYHGQYSPSLRWALPDEGEAAQHFLESGAEGVVLSSAEAPLTWCPGIADLCEAEPDGVRWPGHEQFEPLVLEMALDPEGEEMIGVDFADEGDTESIQILRVERISLSGPSESRVWERGGGADWPVDGRRMGSLPDVITTVREAILELGEAVGAIEVDIEVRETRTQVCCMGLTELAEWQAAAWLAAVR